MAGLGFWKDTLRVEKIQRFGVRWQFTSTMYSLPTEIVRLRFLKAFSINIQRFSKLLLGFD